MFEAQCNFNKLSSARTGCYSVFHQVLLLLDLLGLLYPSSCFVFPAP